MTIPASLSPSPSPSHCPFPSINPDTLSHNNMQNRKAMPRRAHDPRHAVVSNEHYLVGRHEAHPADIVRHDAVSDAEGQEEHGEEEIEENSQGGGEVRGEFEDKGSGEVGGEEELCVWDGGLE